MRLSVLNAVNGVLRNAQFFTIMADETTDTANVEQVVVCLHWVDSKFEVHEELVGLHSDGSTDANTLVKVIKDVLLCMDLPSPK